MQRFGFSILMTVLGLSYLASCSAEVPTPRSQSDRQGAPAAVTPTSLVGSKSRGTEGTRIVDQIWEDKSRERQVPVKIYVSANRSQERAPVVIFSHGLGGSTECAGYLGAYLSARGYVCVHIQHHGSDREVWQSAIGGGRSAILASLKPAASAQNLRLRADDVSFVLDELTARNNSDPLLKDRLDLSAVAIAGHSFGAGTALAVAGQSYIIGPRVISLRDPRIKAAVYLSPPVNLRGRDPNPIFGSIQIPGLLMTGTEDNSPIGETSAAERPVPFYTIGGAHQYLVNFQGGDHMIFSGHTRPGRAASDEEFQSMISTVTGAFLDAHLRHDASRENWLKKDCAAFLGKKADYKLR